MSTSTSRTLLALGAYVSSALPAARAHARRWAGHADAIPSPGLREHADRALRFDDVNVIATAALALLAPRAHRRTTIELLMAWRVICSYVDELGEQPARDPLANGLHLHRALLDAVSPTVPPLGGYYAYYGDDADGGYLDALVAVCRRRLSELCASPELEQVARLGAQRCAEAQTHLHTAALTGSTHAMRRWAAAQPIVGDWHWWEIVAASIADLPIMAALAASAIAPERAYAAHWPAAALASLLDSVADLDDDMATGDFSLVANYASDDAVRERLGVIALRAREATRSLPGGHIHSAIAIGIVAHYVALAGRSTSRAATLMSLARESMRPTITPILMTVRAHRIISRCV